MKRMLFSTLAAALLLGTCLAGASKAHWPQDMAVEQSHCLPWHGAYYDPAWGEPIALVVPPTAEFQSNYGWGVSGMRVAPIYHQFSRPYPGPGGVVGYPGFQPTPYWPSDTQQFGVYYIRGPWGTY